jgi:hypothetical protein
MFFADNAVIDLTTIVRYPFGFIFWHIMKMLVLYIEPVHTYNRS